MHYLRAQDTRHKSCPPLIGTMTTDTRTAVVLSCYEDITLNGVGMRIELMGPGDMTRMRGICEGILAGNSADSDAGSNLTEQIHEMFFNSEISDV